MKRLTAPEIQTRNFKKESPLVCLTAYTAPFAKILDPYVDILLVGDSVGMVLYGMTSTLSVTLEMMYLHGKAVVNASSKACVVVDMPFASYQGSSEQAFRNAAKIMSRTGCSAVKLEGGKDMANTIEFLTKRGIPVMAHVGLMPQHVNIAGGYRCHGKTPAEHKKILADSIAIEQAGAFSVVLEGITKPLAEKITAKLSIPTIGIGASNSCCGQVLVTEDMAGLFGDIVPKFVKQYGNLKEELEKSAKQFADDVRTRKFPTDEYCYIGTVAK